MRHVLVTGGAGQVGQALAQLAWPSGWQATFSTRADLDLTVTAAIAARIAERRWSAVINAAAYTAVDRAETETSSAWAVNALGPGALAAACRDADVPLVHISTDYVFDGTKIGAWDVGDPVGPLGVYGASKLAGELAIGASGARHAIIRSA